MSSQYIPKRALFIYAHPDDIEFGVAGTAAKWAQNGCEVTYIIITDGNIGTDDENITAEELATVRRTEQTAAARVAGAECVFLGYPDGQLEPTLGLRRDLTREIRRYKPNVVVCGDPTVYFPAGRRFNHPDHRAAAIAALDAIYPSADSPLLFPELLEEGFGSHKVNYMYISNSPEPNLYIDISDTIDLKIEALRQHKSQLGDWDPDEPLREWNGGTGKKVGFAYAEAFRRIVLREDEPEKEEDTASAG